MTPRCDMILLTCGNLEVLKPCVESLFETTRTPSHLVIVDNNSNQPTKDFLHSIRGNDTVTVEIVTNEKNEGFVLGMNRGMKMSTAPYVALLNDDLIFTEGWLGCVLEAGKKHPQIGILNPSSNTFSDHPPKGRSLEQYAEDLRQRFSGRVCRIATASGFCMVIKRELIQKIGYLDEAFIPFFFEDTDYSCRAAAAGFQCAVVKDSYVYHHEHRSFPLYGIQRLSEIFKRNQDTFNKKWGRQLRILIPLILDAESDAQSFKERLEILSEWSYQRCFLYVPLRLRRKSGFEELESTFFLKERSGIQFFPFSHSPFFDLYCAYRVLRRRKKPLDCLFFFDGKPVGPLFERLGAFLHLPLFSIEEGTLVVQGGDSARKIAPFHFSEFPSLAREIIQ